MEFKRFFYTNYYVSKCGTLKRVYKGKEKIYKPKSNKVEFYINGQRRRTELTRMIMIVWNFREDYPFKKVGFKNGNEINLDNLIWL